jgi:hypothetical protein
VSFWTKHCENNGGSQQISYERSSQAQRMTKLPIFFDL